MSILKSSSDRVIANAPIIINRDSELYQRYWKQRLPRRVSIKAIQSEEDDVGNVVEVQKVDDDDKTSQEQSNDVEVIGVVGESLPLVQDEDPVEDAGQGPMLQNYFLLIRSSVL